MFSPADTEPKVIGVEMSQADCEKTAGRLNKQTELERRNPSKLNKGMMFICAKAVPPQA